MFVKTGNDYYAEQERYDWWFEEKNEADYDCPYCHNKGKSVRYGYYDRDVITIRNTKRIVDKIKVHRLQCICCKRTYTLLPDFLFINGSYSDVFVRHILAMAENRSESVRDFCRKWCISTSTFYSWRTQMTNGYQQNCETDTLHAE